MQGPPQPAAAPGAWAPQPQTPPSLPSDEQAQLLAALRQPLFLQTPLQSLLEHVVQRVTTSAALADSLHKRVSALERTCTSQADVLDRVRELEARLEAPSAAATPFAVAQLAGRVGALEGVALRLEEDAKLLKYQAGDVLERRLASAEARLAGVTNLRGRLMALDVVAQELGVAVPDAHYVSPATDIAGSGGTAGSGGSSGSSGNSSGSTATTTGAANSALPAAAPAFKAACMISRGSAQSDGGGGSAAASGGAGAPSPLATSGGAVPSRTRQELDALRAQLEAAQAEGRGAQDALARLEARVGALTQELAEADDRQTTSAARQQDAAQSLADALAAQLAALRREALRPPEVSLAEFSRMQSAVSRAAEESQSAAQGARAAQEAGAALRSAVEELQRRVGRALGVRDADRALNEGLEGLRHELEALSARVDAAQAAALAGEGVASQSQLRELLDHMRGGVASKADVRAVLGRSVELALDAYRRAAGDVAGSGATRFRCLVCDRELHDPPRAPEAAAEPQQLRPPSPGGWPPATGPLPRMAAFSPPPSTAASQAGVPQRRRSHGRAASPPLQTAPGTADSSAPGGDGTGAPGGTGSSGDAPPGADAAAAARQLPALARVDAAAFTAGLDTAVAGGAAGSAPSSPLAGGAARRPGTSAAGGLAARAATAGVGLRGAWTAGNERLTGSKPRRGPPIFL